MICLSFFVLISGQKTEYPKSTHDYITNGKVVLEFVHHWQKKILGCKELVYRGPYLLCWTPEMNRRQPIGIGILEKI